MSVGQHQLAAKGRAKCSAGPLHARIASNLLGFYLCVPTVLIVTRVPQTTSLEPKRSGAGLELPSGGSAVLSTTSSSSGAVAAAAIGAVGGLESPATSSSKSKGITSKLKSLFKKDK